MVRLKPSLKQPKIRSPLYATFYAAANWLSTSRTKSATVTAQLLAHSELNAQHTILFPSQSQFSPCKAHPSLPKVRRYSCRAMQEAKNEADQVSVKQRLDDDDQLRPLCVGLLPLAAYTNPPPRSKHAQLYDR
jgi:hypothetical protein